MTGMSLIRFGEHDSSVYVIGDPDDGCWLCVACGLSAAPSTFGTDADRLAQLEAHAARGDSVPLEKIQAKMQKEV